MSAVNLKKKISRIGTNEPVDSCVIFIHGIAGGISSWDTFTKQLENRWNTPDSFGVEYDEYTIEVNFNGFINKILKIFSGGPGIELLSGSFKTTIEHVCRDYDNIIIVAHSMGGLIARKYIVDLVKKTKNIGKIKALITYATPHHGSRLASLYKKLFLRYLFFPICLSSTQIYGMCRSDSPFIIQLNKDWDALRIDTKLDFWKVLGLRDWVVDRESAAFNTDDPFCFPVSNKGHLNIISPKSPKDPAFMVTYNYLKNFKLELEKKIELEELEQLDEDEFDDQE